VDVETIELKDASGFAGTAERLLTPASLEELVGILNGARAGRVPVTILGSRTGITGGSMPRSGWAVSMEKFRRLEIGEGRARCGAAVTLNEIAAEAGKTNQFYAPDPTEWTASVGGTINTNASGSRSFKYGSTRNHVLGLLVAHIDGTVREYKRGEPIDFDVPELPLPATTKCTAGYQLKPGMDWVDLFCGSEGTLGVVVEAGLKLLKRPKSLLAGVVFFPTMDQGFDAVDAWRGVDGLRMLEFIDFNTLDLMRPSYPEIPAEAKSALMIESEDPDADAWVDRLEAAGALLEASWFGETDRDRERFRVFRHAAPERVNETVLRRGFLKLGSDFAVPVARTREMADYYYSVLKERWPGQYVIYGHVGDGHLHVNLLPASPEENRLGNEIMKDWARQAVALGGTVSAEHGLGKRKSHFLKLQYSSEQIEAMKQVKRRLDPDWLLGNGNLFPEV
jgi:FAD/FMN-containing dehydrogenase